MAGAGREPTILIVDDEERLRKALGRSFRQDGYQTRGATCGEEALAVLAGEPVDVVITDLVMPGMEGMALVRALQTAAPGTKVIILTAYGSAKSMAEAAALGVSGYLTKPFDLSQLKSRVHKLVRAPAASLCGRGGGWGLRGCCLACSAVGAALGTLASLPRKAWPYVRPRQVVFTAGKAVGAVSWGCLGIRRRFAEAR